MANLILTEDQEAAAKAILGFFAEMTTNFFVLEGFSGTGKTTLMQHVLNSLAGYMKTCKLLDRRHPGDNYNLMMTATTNKAAEAMAKATGYDTKTVYSALELRVQTNYKTGKTTLVGDKLGPIEYDILVIDEASYIDEPLLKILQNRVRRSKKYTKVLFIGDPAQLVQVGYNYAPVFTAGFPTVRMTKVVRQAETNPIIGLSAMFRNALETGQFTPFKLDHDKIQKVDDSTLEGCIDSLFAPGAGDNRVLAWRNKTVVEYNAHINNKLNGRTGFVKGDYALVNSYVPGNRPLKNDEIVHIQEARSGVVFDVAGHHYMINYRMYFCPNDYKAKAQLLKEAREDNDSKRIAELMECWVDLRPVYAQTVNKSQGSTYDNVLIDLNDISKCNSGAQIARMLYVAVSRARERVYLYGDLV